MNSASRTTVPFGPLPPQSLDAERGVLASMLREPSLVPQVASELHARDFYRDDHAGLYAAILGLQDANRRIDPITAVEELVRTGRYDHAEANALAVEVLESFSFADYVDDYVALVLDAAKKRRIIKAAEGVLRQAYDPAVGSQALGALAERSVFSATRSEGLGRIVSIGEAMDDVLARCEPGRGPLGRVTTGLDKLDHFLGYLQPGHLVVIAARTSIGKSALALGIAGHIAADLNEAVYFASLEMTGPEVGVRYLSSKADVSSYRINDPGTLADADRRALEQARRRHRDVPLLIDESGRQTVALIAARCRRIQAERPLAAVFVDYLSLISFDGPPSTPRTYQVASMTWGFKCLAKELGVPVVLLVQINRESEAGRGQAKPGEKRDHRPRLHHLKDSGSIEQDANTVILLHRPDFYDPDDRKGEADLFIAKNRGGATGRVTVYYDARRTTFTANRVEPDITF